MRVVDLNNVEDCRVFLEKTLTEITNVRFDGACGENGECIPLEKMTDKQILNSAKEAFFKFCLPKLDAIEIECDCENCAPGLPRELSRAANDGRVLH